MSSILKALKKLEDEKTIRKPDSLKIDSEILRGDASQRISTTGISLLAAFLFVCGSGATYFFMKPDTKVITGTQSKAYVVEPSRPASSAATVATVAKNPQSLNLQAELPKTGKVVSTRSDLKLDKTATTPVKSPELTARVQSVQQSKQSDGKQSVVPSQKAPVPAARATTPAMTPSLKVNGIAFQDESADRVAIVNGISVSNGSLIEGAKVEDIQKDRVRFSYGGEKFDVALGKSNR